MKKLISCILAVIFLGSNLGFAVGNHFCGGHIMETEVVLGYKDLGCGMMPEVKSDLDHTHTSLHTVPCCLNEFRSLQLDNDYQGTFSNVFVEPVAALTPLFDLTDQTNSINTRPSLPEDNPPLPSGEITILLQVFRI